MFSLIHWNKVCEEKNKLSSDHSSVLLQLEMYLRYFCSHHMNWWTAMWVYLEEVTVVLILTLPLGRIRWPLHELMCYCFLSVCAHACILACHYQWMENLVSVRFTPTSHGFPFFQRDWWQNYMLISKRQWQRETGSERQNGIVWSDLLCSCVLQGSWKKKYVNFRIFDNILNSILA